MGKATVQPTSAAQLVDATRALRSAVTVGGTELPEGPREKARAIVEKVGQRTSLIGGHTVVALAGATGSGKSSLFNALVGTDIATVGARRPTTSTPTAAIWGEESADELLDWLSVSRRHHVPTGAADAAPDATGAAGSARGNGTVGRLDGLVLLDLPDFDSREAAHRAEAERVLELVDLFVWVTDPQKYADARLHDDYVAALSTHDAVTMVVLNQVDRLREPEVEQCVEDLQRLMARDGMPGATVLPVSAVTGRGLDDLRQRLANTVSGANASRARLAADVRAGAGRLRPAVGATEAVITADREDDLIDALARTAGVPTVVDAVARDYKMEAVGHAGWPFTRWVQQFRPKPLRRLRLDGLDVPISASDVRAVLGRSSLPPPTPAARAAVALANRQLVDRASAGLPLPWADAVERAATSEDLSDALDQAVVRTSLRARNPIWWRVAGLLQLLFAIAAIAGLLWLLVLMVLGWLQLPVPEPAQVGPLPWPFVLLVGGLVAGLLLALLARVLAGIGARRRSAVMEDRLHDSIGAVADERILEPIVAVLRRHAETREHLDRAARI
jgi:predicted GTPase